MHSGPYLSLAKSIEDGVHLYTITMTKGQNQFWPESVDEWHSVLDIIESDIKLVRSTSSDDPSGCLVVTGQEKFFTTGLHLTKIGSVLNEFLRTRFLPLLGRLLTFSLATVAAINGHAYAGGMCLAMACDYRLMRGDRGYLCMNEIDLPSIMPDGMAELLKCKIANPRTLRECFMEGRRWSADEALADGLIDGKIEDVKTLLSDAKKLAVKHARPIRIGEVVHLIKAELYREAHEVLSKPRPITYFEVFMRNKL